MIPAHLIPAAELAASEGRLFWRCTDAEGRPANGGSADPLPLGEWSPEREPVMCSSGWHVTSDPVRWRGTRVWLVEVDAVAASYDDKAVARRIRPLAEVDPAQCLDPRIGARIGRRDLDGANLRGAKLTGADLRGANLRWANLYGADIYGANLSEADLTGANLTWANLYGADLRGAYLGGANLGEANLRGADLTGATLAGADLGEADLTGANLRGAYLGGANLYGANLGEWERGPDGFARRKA